MKETGGFHRIVRAVAVVGYLAIIAMMANIILDVFMRSVFNSPIPGTLEVSSYWYMAGITFIGILYAFNKGEHVSVPLLVERLTVSSRTLLLGFEWLVTVTFLVALAIFGLLYAIEAWSVGQYAGVFEIPTWPMMFAVPITLFISACLVTFDARQEYRSLHAKN